MAAPKGRPKPLGSGRKKGQPNKATIEIKTVAQLHGPAAINALADLMKNADSDAAKVSAARELLDRGYGKAAQEITGANGSPLVPSIIQFVLDADSA